MLADVDELVDPDDAPGLRLGTSADTGDERVPPAEPAKQRARRGRHARVLRAVDDRRERPVDVEQERSLRGPLGQTRDRISGVHRYRENRRDVVQLVLIGVAAGFFSALFGVGGGIIVVPLLLLLGSWQQRPAMATSLAAIGIIALAGTISYGLHGDLKPGAAAIVGLPAAAGAIAGTSLQQRIANRTLSYLFALVLVGLAVKLLL